jgi:hypothetical protein
MSKKLNELALPPCKVSQKYIGLHNIYFDMEGYCIAPPKHSMKPIPSLGYLVITHHGSTLLEGYCRALPKPINKTIPCL